LVKEVNQIVGSQTKASSEDGQADKKEAVFFVYLPTLAKAGFDGELGH